MADPDPDAADRGRYPLRLIAGTQVVSRVAVTDDAGAPLVNIGAVGVVVEDDPDTEPADRSADTGAGSGRDTGPGPGSGSGAGLGSGSDMGSGADLGSDMDTGSGAGSDTETGSGSDTDTGSGAGLISDSGTDTGSAAGAEHRYRVRFPGGPTVLLGRDELSLRRRVQETSLGPPADPASLVESLLPDHLIFQCLIGSKAYGLDREGSDEDRRGIFLAPASLLWSLQGAPDFLERPHREEAYWELRKFLVLALKANPNALECLYSPLVERVTGPGDELLAMRDAFVSKLAYQTYNGYVLSQFRKIEGDLRNHGEPKWKHVMHLIRLLLSGISVLGTGTVEVRVGDQRDRLLAIRDGEVPWDEVVAWRVNLHAELDEAYASSRLPELPDYARVDRFLIEARRASARHEDGAAR